MNPIAYRINDAVTVTGISRSKLFELIGSGDITARKLGRATLIERAELERYIATLPTNGGDQ